MVALRLVLDLDTERTAQVLGIAPGTVQAHLGRAMAVASRRPYPYLAEGETIMNDDELITVLREQRAKSSNRPRSVEQIISRGRAVRARRRVPGWPGRWGRRPRQQSP